MKSDILFHEQQQVSPAPLILAVEDNVDNLLIIDYIVQSLNCRFIGETNGLNVLSLARDYQPDLILLDIMLPNVDGTDILYLLRQDFLTQFIPVIAVTALVMEKDQHRIHQAGFNDYLTKPYSVEQLEDLICRHLQWVKEKC